MHFPLRLRCDTSALSENYKRLSAIAGVPAGAAIKANGYGVGAVEVAHRLLDAGCRDFFVSSWPEAAELGFLPDESLSVLHGLGPDDEPIEGVRPVLCSTAQIADWKARGLADRPCDVMVDTGMNRLGLAMTELSAIEGLRVHTLHSHLACADEEHPLNALQLDRFRTLRNSVKAGRYSLANSAGIFRGADYSFDLVRPGLALYGGIPRLEARGVIRPVVAPQAQVIQTRTVRAGESVGYNATFTAPRDLTAVIVNIGYADGYWRAFSSLGHATYEEATLPVLGRVSMDLVTLDASAAGRLREGDWVALDFDLERAAGLTGFSQYELLTGLGRRLARSWT
ncbi:alanine racemase [Sphingomonas astaxanthinifaciens]|uniref:alanine racemase n=1 Tax=Sphingomonas astaxanthinifaciens DSM 22298 TaxID=1123267 RepID=A0ABQ5ZC03_9SPHN|nr:alanine racemase [Sphingomonas astaxanthinifaciens]GLR48408.1 alanine racemase [Sphingomonas astaxanthinifaciens DSM 22298]